MNDLESDPAADARELIRLCAVLAERGHLLASEQRQFDRLTAASRERRAERRASRRANPPGPSARDQLFARRYVDPSPAVPVEWERPIRAGTRWATPPPKSFPIEEFRDE